MAVLGRHWKWAGKFNPTCIAITFAQCCWFKVYQRQFVSNLLRLFLIRKKFSGRRWHRCGSSPRRGFEHSGTSRCRRPAGSQRAPTSPAGPSNKVSVHLGPVFSSDSANVGHISPLTGQLKFFFNLAALASNNFWWAGHFFIYHLVPEERKHFRWFGIEPRSIKWPL